MINEKQNREIVEQSLADMAKEKAMLEIEIKHLMNRHKTETDIKDKTIEMVRGFYV